jgi:phage baseplate assembly protein W
VTEIAFPFHVDGRGRTADTDADDHVRDLVEQLLFTAPGERVNRPTFGSGLLRLVFEPNREELATALEALVQGSLQQWLADVVQVQRVDVTADEGTLTIVVEYVVRRTLERQIATFERSV